jgi:hypothetical protein
MAGEGAGKAEGLDFEAQAEAAADTIRAAVLRLLKEGEVHPRVVVLAAALAGGEDAEEVLGGLAGVVREAGRDHYEALRAVTLPTAGSA